MRRILLASLSIILPACSSPNTGVTQAQFGTTKALVTAGNTRLVTERSRPGYPHVVCTEPSPDYAVAFGHTAKLTGKIVATGGSSSDGTVDVSSTELVTAGAGREAAVLALRDGLYAACQSYANGVIGHDAYAMILSQYGTLLVALVGNAPKDSARYPDLAARQATLSALVVACISGHDLTRASGPSNTLLTPAFCSAVLRGALRKSMAT